MDIMGSIGKIISVKKKDNDRYVPTGYGASGAVCGICQQNMKTADGCIKTPVSGKSPIKYGSEKDAHNYPAGRCHDCYCKKGKYHHRGCDMEDCPICGSQLISCGHLS